MQVSKRVKNILSYLSLLAVMAAMVVGLLMAKDIHRTTLNSGNKAATEFPSEQNRLPLLIDPGETGTCFLPEIYTSLPPKCRTLDGSFIQIPGTYSDVFVIPQGK